MDKSIDSLFDLISGQICCDPFNCDHHSKRWHLVNDNGVNICAKCCQRVWISQSETHCQRRHLLSVMESCLRYGSKFPIFLKTSQECDLFFVTILRLLYGSDTQTQILAKNCLNLLITQINTNSIFQFIFQDILQKMNSDKSVWNESTLDLMGNLFQSIDICGHQMSDEIDILFEKFRSEFFGFTDQLKTIVLKMFEKYYSTSMSNQLFVLDFNFHQKTQKMIFATFEAMDDNRNDRQLVIQSIRLMKIVSKVPLIVKNLTSDKNFVKYLQKLLNEKSIEIHSLVLEWILNLLEEEAINKCLAKLLECQMMDTFIDLLNSSENSSISLRLLSCLILLLDILTSINTKKLESMSKSILKTLEFSFDTKDNELFMIALTAFKQIIDKNSNIHFLSEFDFFSLIDLLQYSMSSSKLFTQIVLFLTQFFDLKIIPVMVPTEKMKTILTVVFDNINDPNSDVSQQLIEKSILAVKLIRTYLKLINSVKDNSFDKQIHEIDGKFINLLNAEKELNLNDFQINESFERQSNHLIEVSERTEIFEILSMCLEYIETIFEQNLNQLFDSEENSENNSKLFNEISSCIQIIFGNALFVSEDINKFVSRMFSKGYVVSLLQLLWFCEPPLKSNSFLTDLSSILSDFLFKIQAFEYENDNRFRFGTIFDRNRIFEAILSSRDNSSNLSLEWDIDLNDENKKQFFQTFFALNYYSFKFNPKENFRIDGNYSYKLKEICEKYLENFYQFDETEDLNSVLTLKHLLFLSAIEDLNEKCVEVFRLFFDKRDEHFLSKYWTNHIILLKYVFNRLNCDNLCEYSLKEFLKLIPDYYMNFTEKDIISSFFQLIDSNEKCLNILLVIMCDSTDELILQVFEDFLKDSEQFIDEYDICENWRKFRLKVFKRIPVIIIKIIETIAIDFKTESRSDTGIDIDIQLKITKLLQFLGHLLLNGMNDFQFESFIPQFKRLLEKLCLLFDNPLDDSTVRTILKFFRSCVDSDEISMQLTESLTKTLLQSKSVVLRIFTSIDSDLTSKEDFRETLEEGSMEDKEASQEDRDALKESRDFRETSFFLLSVLSKSKNIWKHSFIYEMDINSLITSLDSDSKVETKSAFDLFHNSFKTYSYFESKNKSEEIKLKEMQRLLFSLQNAFIRKYITLDQMTDFLSDLFNDLKEINLNLMQDLVKNPWFQTLIDSYIKDNDITEELIDFLILFSEIEFINTSLVDIINDLIKKFVEIIDNTDDNICDFKGKVLKLLETIDLGIYGEEMTEHNIKILKTLSQRQSFSCYSDHNYCFD